MVAWFIIAIATLAVFAFIAVGGVQTVAATTDGVGRVETVRRLDSAANALLSRAASPNSTGKIFLLAGQQFSANGTSYYTLPNELSSYGTTPFGQPVVYCPFGDNESGTPANVPYGGATYPIETNLSQGKAYVTGGPRPGFAQVQNNPNLLAFLMAPRTKTSATPSCSSVRYNPTTRRFEAPDAIVRAVIRNSGGEEAREQMSREVVYYVSPNGNGRGLAANDTTSLQTAIDFYRTRQPAAMRIVFARGTYGMAQNSLNTDTFTDRGTNPSLSLVGDGQAQVLSTTSSGVNYIQTAGDLSVNGVLFDNTTFFYASRGRRYRLNNTTMSNLFAVSSAEATVSEANIMSNANGYAVLASAGGRITVQGNVQVGAINGGNAIGAINSGVVQFADSAQVTYRVSTSGTIGIANFVGDGSTMNASSTRMIFASPTSVGVRVYGRYNSTGTVYNVAASVSDAIQLLPGSQTVIEGGAMEGTRPNWNITDYGGSKISGTNFVMTGTSGCWGIGNAAFKLFSESDQSNGGSSAVRANDPVPNMTSIPPSPAEYQAYTTAMNNNQRRDMLRSMNLSSWTCQK